MSIHKNYFLLILLAMMMTVTACQKRGKVGTDLKPIMGLVGSDEVSINGKVVNIDDLHNVLTDLRIKIGPPMQDSIAVQFELEQGVDKVALNRVKEKLTAAGIFDLKFIVPFGD